MEASWSSILIVLEEKKKKLVKWIILYEGPTLNLHWLRVHCVIAAAIRVHQMLEEFTTTSHTTDVLNVFGY